MFDKVTIVDCRGHLLGRLASTVAKELLSGQRVVRRAAALRLAAACTPAPRGKCSRRGPRRRWGGA